MHNTGALDHIVRYLGWRRANLYIFNAVQRKHEHGAIRLHHQVLVLKHLLDPTGNHLIVTHLFRKIKRKFGSVRKLYCQCTLLCHRVLPVYSSYLTNSSIPHYRHQPRAVCAWTLPTLTYRVEKQVGSTSEGTGKADTPIFDFGR